jgi:glucokinase
MTEPDALVADIGATNARFGLLDRDGTVIHNRTLACADYRSLEDAAEAYLGMAAPAVAPARAAVAIAGPVTGDVVHMTNPPWVFTVVRARARLGLDRLIAVNDFTAVAMAVPLLGPADRLQVGDGAPVPGEVIGVLGPGTGLGVSGLVPGHRGGWRALSGEGGHVTMAPVSDRESAVLAQLRKQYDHVSAERTLSGMGLVNLYRAICLLDGREPEELNPRDVTARALDGGDRQCVEAVETFCAMLGTVAGNLALTLGARGGVFVAGGIVPRLGGTFVHSRFRKRFVEKGRMRDFLGPIPTYVVTHPLPAFLGLKGILDQSPD